MLPPWPPLDLTQEIDFAHHGIPAYRPKHPSCNVLAILVAMISITITCEPQSRVPLLTCIPSNNTCALVFRETSCYALSISRFLRTEVKMEVVTAKVTYTSPYQLGIENIDNGNKTHMQQEELYLCQNRTAYSILQFGIKAAAAAAAATVAASAASWLHRPPAWMLLRSVTTCSSPSTNVIPTCCRK